MFFNKYIAQPTHIKCAKSMILQLDRDFARKNPLLAAGFKPWTFLPRYSFLTGLSNSPNWSYFVVFDEGEQSQLFLKGRFKLLATKCQQFVSWNGISSEEIKFGAGFVSATCFSGRPSFVSIAFEDVGGGADEEVDWLTRIMAPTLGSLLSIKIS